MQPRNDAILIMLVGHVATQWRHFNYARKFWNKKTNLRDTQLLCLFPVNGVVWMLKVSMFTSFLKNIIAMPMIKQYYRDDFQGRFFNQP